MKADETVRKVVQEFSLVQLPRPGDLARLAVTWGVSEIEQKSIASDAMLLPTANGYKIILKSLPRGSTRQRFSFAHELGHLLLQKSGYSRPNNGQVRHRLAGIRDEEEIICDQLAAEILMPQHSFVEDAARAGWGLDGLQPLARLYEASIPATARRMVDLMEEPCLMGVWKPATGNETIHSLEQSYDSSGRFGVRNSTGIASRRLWLIGRAARSRQVEQGIAPVVDKGHPRAAPADAPAEAWAWSRDEFRRVMVFYYPKRALTEEMKAIARATWQPTTTS